MARLQQKTQAAVTTGPAEATGIPCAMGYGLYAPSPVSGLFSHRRLVDHHKTWFQRRGIGTARLRRPRPCRSSCGTNASIASRTRRSWRRVRPSGGYGTGEDNHTFPKNGSGIFLAPGL